MANPFLRFAFALGALLTLGVSDPGCQSPSDPTALSPELHGRLYSQGGAVTDGEVVLSLRYPDNSRLARTVRTTLDPAGRFSFAPVMAVVTGQEYRKDYRVYLHHELDGQQHVLWRADYARTRIGERLLLACDADVEPGKDMACRIEPDDGGPQWLVDAGRADFVRHCASCHGLDARGQGPSAAALRTPPADLTRIAQRFGGTFPRGLAKQWIDGRFSVAAHGTREMPIWGVRLGDGYAPGEFGQSLIRGRIDNLISYLESLQSLDSESGELPNES